MEAISFCHLFIITTYSIAILFTSKVQTLRHIYFDISFSLLFSNFRVRSFRGNLNLSIANSFATYYWNRSSFQVFLKKRPKSHFLRKILAIKTDQHLSKIGLKSFSYGAGANLRDYKLPKTIPLKILDGPHFRKDNYPNPYLKQHFSRVKDHISFHTRITLIDIQARK